MEMHAFLLSSLLLTLLPGPEARSVDQVCSEKCTDGIRQFFVNNDYEYTYTYSTTVESSFHTRSSRDQKAYLRIYVPFSIITNSDCNLVLQVKRGIYIDHMTPRTDEEVAWQAAVTTYPLHFSWQNGVVENVCPSINEPTWVTNFKRGILSAIQMTTTTSRSAVKELDVSGDCEVNYSVEDDGTMVINKTKDYTKCTNRNKHLLFSWSLPYDHSSPRQNYIYSQQSCQHVVADVLQSVECTEEHVFRPFSTDEAGARTNVRQRVVFQGQNRLRSIPYSSVAIRRSDLAFEVESELGNSNMEEKTQAAKDLLTEICATMKGENYQRVGKDFISLVYVIRELDAESLTELNTHVDTCTERNSSLKQMIANTLPFCGTNSCVALATSLMMDNTLDKRVAKRWLAGFSLINKPSVEMISSILVVVASGKYPEQSFLATGSMIHQFCQNSKVYCMNNRVIRSSLSILMQNLGRNCRSPNSESRKMTLIALRAIGNAGQTTSSRTLRRCIVETDNPVKIRVAAVNAYRRMSYSSTYTSVLLRVLQNPVEDSELRITSYINLMQRPTADLVTIMKNMLETEQSMQVGSFIWSHLTQVMESQDPLKHFFQVLLRGHTFKDFSLDSRKYSRYYEASLFSENLNSGGTAEANLIWSPKSFIPRAASVNFTLYLFGQAVNLFEFGGRVEGAENLIQSILEPKAYERRNARNDLQPFVSERRTTEIKTAATKAQASWFMRVFGNELVYGNTDMPELIESQYLSLFSDVMAKFLTDDGYTYHDDVLILNSIHTLPTGNGLPLRVAFNGSTTIDVNAAGRISNMGSGSNAKSLVKVKFNPMGALVVTGSMTVDAHIRRTGITTESVAYTSTSLSGSVKIYDVGRSFDFEIDSPFNRNTVFNFKHKLLKIEGESASNIGGTIPFLTLTENTDCTDVFLGQRFCFTKRYHDARLLNVFNVFNVFYGFKILNVFKDDTSSYIFPTNGEVTLFAYMEKVDPGLAKYTINFHIRTESENEEDMIPQNLALRLYFNTPGSDVNRKATMSFSYSIPGKQIDIKVQHGEAVLLRLHGVCLSGDGSNGIHISANYKEEIYGLMANARWTFEYNRKQMATDLTIVLPSKTMTINGMLDHHAAKGFQGSIEMNDVLPTPVVIRIHLQDNSESQVVLSLRGNGKMIVPSFINSEFTLDMGWTPKILNLGFYLNYKITGSPKQNFRFRQKTTSLGRSGETDWTISQMFTSSQFTALNHNIYMSHKYSKGSTTSNLDVGYGPRMEEPDNEYKLVLRQECSDTSDSTTTRMNGQWEIDFPHGGVYRNARLSYERGANILYVNIENIITGNAYHSTFLWKNNAPGSPLRNENLEISLYLVVPLYLDGNYKLVNTLQEVVENVYDVRSNLSLGDLEELQFIQEITITNKADNKSIELIFFRKGMKESWIMRGSSVNYAVGGTRHVSNNLIHVMGCDQRRLYLAHDTLPTKGCRTSVNFMKGSTATVSLEFTYRPTANGKHYIMSARQYKVSEWVSLAKFGYDYIPDRLFETYTTITDPDDDETLSFRTTTRLSADYVWSGNFLLTIHSFYQNIDYNTTVSYMIGDAVEIDYRHRCRDKNVHFTAVTTSKGIHGILQHNYCDYFNDVSYNVARISNSVVKAMISSGRHQARAIFYDTTNYNRLRLYLHSVNELFIERTYSVGESSIEINMIIKWNGEKKIGWKMVKGWTEYGESHWFRYEIYQQFVNPHEVTAGYRYEQMNGWQIVNTTVTGDRIPFIVVARYKPIQGRQSKTCKFNLDIRQSYMKILPPKFTTNGIVTHGESLFDSDWQVTAGGEDMFTLKKHFEGTDEGYNTHIGWTHPFEDLYLSYFDGSLNWQLGPESLTITSDVTHSENCKYFPKHFTTTGRITIGDSIYENDWKIVSEGQELVVFKKYFKIIENGYQVTFKWKQPNENIGLTHFFMHTILLLQTDTIHLTVDIDHPFDHPHIPKYFVTTGVVTVGEKLYDSNWKITSGEQNIAILKKLFRGTDNGFNTELHWKQPYDEFVVKSIDSNVVFTKERSASKFTGTMRYNDAREWSTHYGWVATNSYSRNYTIGYTADGQRYETHFFYASQPWRSTGNTMTFVYDNVIPQECIFAKYLPTQQHFYLTTYKKEFNMQFKSAYSAIFIPQRNTMLDSSLTSRNSTESTEQIDGELELKIDETGVIVEFKGPAQGLDQSVNVTYDQQTHQIKISYIRSGQEPIVTTINLSEFVPRLKQIIDELSQRIIIPELNIVGDINHEADSLDAFVRVRIRDTSYTIQLNSGYANQQRYMNITTKRNFAVLHTILSTTAKLIKPETVQIQIQTSKKFGRFLNSTISSSNAELKNKVVDIADVITETLQSLEIIVQGSDRIQRAIDDKRTLLLQRVTQTKEISIEFIDSIITGILDSMTNDQKEINSGMLKAITALPFGIDRLREIVNRSLQKLKHDYLTKVSKEIFNRIQLVLQPVLQVLKSFHCDQLLLELVQEGVTEFVFVRGKNAEILLSPMNDLLAKLMLFSEDKVTFNAPLHVPARETIMNFVKLNFMVKGLIGPPKLGDIAMWIVQDFSKGHAEITSFKHFRTFDGRRYNYTSLCGSKHVLARDVKDNEFTVAVNYRPRPSIEIVSKDSRNRETIIVLKADYSVTDDQGKALISPNKYEDVLVKRVGDILSVRTTYGLLVSCNFVSDICTVDVSPFYFTRLAGMLGTFNNEPYDDYMGPGMAKFGDSEDLALAWMQPGSCSGSTGCIERASERCTEFFEGPKSTFVACFAIEDPTPYKKMCTRDSCRSNGICTAVASYARRCALRGVNLPTPPSCMNCNAAGGGTFGSTQQVEVRGADVVFVVERSRCMRFKSSKYKRFVGKLHIKLNATVARGNINYAVVGFGGPGSLAAPSTVKFGNEIFTHPISYDMTNAEKITILNALKQGQKTRDTQTDILRALIYASQLPFRAGASRAIILISCHDCSGDSEFQISDVRNLLQEQGIVVHHLRQQDIHAGRNAKTVYGFNTRKIYSNNANLPRMELKIPSSDQCLPLVDITGGSVWNLKYFGENTWPLIVDQISRGVSTSLTQECVCGMSEHGTTIAKCRPTGLLGRR